MRSQFDRRPALLFQIQDSLRSRLGLGCLHPRTCLQWMVGFPRILIPRLNTCLIFCTGGGTPTISEAVVLETLD
jgi:hypothetical protein